MTWNPDTSPTYGFQTGMKRSFWIIFIAGGLVISAALAQNPQGGQGASGGSGGRGNTSGTPAALQRGPQIMPLWENGAPGAVGTEDADRPTITMYRPTSPGARGLNSGLAIIIAPGGGYRSLATSYEGTEEAYWLNSLGGTAFVLKYRLSPRYQLPIQLEDAKRAIRLVRSQAAALGIRPDRIGMMGFSAGGHLSALASTQFDDGNPNAVDPVERVGSRPDFVVLCYAVVTFSNPLGKVDLSNLLGATPDPKLVDLLSTELHVTAKTPPAFIFATTNDQLVPVMNSVLYYEALIKAKVPAELHLFADGPHGAGMGLHDTALGEWPKLLENWLRGRGYLTRNGLSGQ